MFRRAMNRSTSAGSNAVPANSRSTAIAAASLRAGRYGRSPAACCSSRRSPGCARRAECPRRAGRPDSPGRPSARGAHRTSSLTGQPNCTLPQDLRADARMDLDALELLGRQRIRLGQDVLGHRHVADVVEQRRGAHPLHLAVGQARGLGERRRVVLNRPDVLGGAARPGFDRERERFDRRELDVHRAPRLVLLFAQPGDDGVVAAEDQVERHREQRQPAEPAACRRRGRDGGQRRAGEIARCAPDEVALPDAAPSTAGSRARSRRRPARSSRRNTAVPPRPRSASAARMAWDRA